MFKGFCYTRVNRTFRVVVIQLFNLWCKKISKWVLFFWDKCFILYWTHHCVTSIKLAYIRWNRTDLSRKWKLKNPQGIYAFANHLLNCLNRYPYCIPYKHRIATFHALNYRRADESYTNAICFIVFPTWIAFLKLLLLAFHPVYHKCWKEILFYIVHELYSVSIFK